MTELNGIVLSRLPVLPLRVLVVFPWIVSHLDFVRLKSA